MERWLFTAAIKLLFPVLANSTYEASANAVKNRKNVTIDNSLNRFSKHVRWWSNINVLR
jgi:hypothetical protein